MTPAITLQELLTWNDEAANFWKAHLGANPALLELPCDIGGAGSVKGLVRHIWGAELRWGQRLAAEPLTDRDKMPAGPLDAIFDMHLQAGKIFSALLAGPEESWDQTLSLDLPWMRNQPCILSRRKILAHALFHTQRHWAQLATLVRAAGFPSGFWGDILFSSALE